MKESIFKFLSKYAKVSSGKGKVNISALKGHIRRVLIESDTHPQVVDLLMKHLRGIMTNTSSTNEYKSKEDFLHRSVSLLLEKIIGNDVKIFKPREDKLNIIKLYGTYGAGKTTFCGKFANLIKEDFPNMNIGMISLDYQREAGQDQLRAIANQVDATFIEANQLESDKQVLNNAMRIARKANLDVLIVDTPGCDFSNEELSKRNKTIYDASNTDLSLFILDGMIGKSAYTISHAAVNCIPIDRIAITKMSSHCMIGPIINARFGMKKPIMCISVNENLKCLRPFVSRNYTDVFMQSINKELNENNKQISNGNPGNKFLDFNTMKQYLLDIKTPENLNYLAADTGNRKEMRLKILALEIFVDSQISIIDSMTFKERSQPSTIDDSRKKRIAQGSGMTEHQVDLLCKKVLSSN